MNKKTKTADKKMDREALSFEEALERAEQLVRELEDGTLGLTESLQKYEQGIGLLGQCFQMLDQAELKIAQLSGFDEQGRPLIDHFDADEVQSLPEKGAFAEPPALSGRRSTLAKRRPGRGPRWGPDEYCLFGAPNKEPSWGGIRRRIQGPLLRCDVASLEQPCQVKSERRWRLLPSPKIDRVDDRASAGPSAVCVVQHDESAQYISAHEDAQLVGRLRPYDQ